MAQTNYTPISLYYSTTASAAPTAGNLVNGELAINITDGKLYYKDNTGTVKVIAGSGGTGVVAGSNTQVQFNNNGVFGAAAGFTWDGTNLTATQVRSSGLTSGRVTYASTSGLLVDSANMTFNGTRLTVADFADSSLTAGRVTYATTSGNLTDSANLLFDGTTLTANALTVSNAVTISGGTANGVAYLNGSKVLTTGSALTFDGATVLVNAVNTSYRGQISIQGGASDFAQISFYRGATTDTNQVGYVHSLNIASSSQAMAIGARNGAFLKFDVGDAQRAAIDTTGRFLLGIQTGNYALDVGDVSGGNMFRFTRSGVELSSFISGGTPFFGTTSNTVLAFMTNSTERGRFDTSGTLLIGATSLATGFGGIAQIEASGSNGGIIINSSSTGASDYSRLIFTKSNSNGNEGLIRYNTNDYHMAFWTNATEKARIDSSGRFMVGRTSTVNNGTIEALGTSRQAFVGQVSDNNNSNFQGFSSSGVATFQVTGAGDVQLRRDDSGPSLTLVNADMATNERIGQIRFSSNGVTGQSSVIDAYGGSGSVDFTDLRFSTASGGVVGERARITSAGQLIVGGTTQIFGNTRVMGQGGPFPVIAYGSDTGYTQGAFVSASGTDSSPEGRGQGVYMWNQGNNTTWYMGTVYGAADTWYLTRKAASGFQDSAAETANAKMWVTSSGVAFQGNNSSTWSTLSDARVKEDVKTIENGLDIVLALRPVEYFNKITKKREENFIAQEYEKVLSKHITRDKPSPAEEEFVTDEILRLNPNLVPYLVSAIQKLNAEIEALKATRN